MTPIVLALAFYYNQLSQGNQSPEVIKDYIVTESLIAGVNPQLALGIVKRESQFNPEAVGDHGNSLGAWQIHMPAHGDISPEQAKDIRWSTQWALTQLKAGNCHIWSTCKDTIKSL